MKNPEKLKNQFNKVLAAAVAETAAAAASLASPQKRGPTDAAPEQPDPKLPKQNAGTAFV